MGRLERISDFLNGTLPSSPEACGFFWSLWSISPVWALKQSGGIKLRYIFDHSDSVETQGKSLLLLSVFRTRFLRAVKFSNNYFGNLNGSLKYIHLFASFSSKYLITIWWLEDITVRNPLPFTVVSFAKKKLSSGPAPEFMPTFYLLLRGWGVWRVVHNLQRAYTEVTPNGIELFLKCLRLPLMWSKVLLRIRACYSSTVLCCGENGQVSGLIMWNLYLVLLHINDEDSMRWILFLRSRLLTVGLFYQS